MRQFPVFGDGGVEAEELGDCNADGGEGEGCAEPGEEGSFCFLSVRSRSSECLVVCIVGLHGDRHNVPSAR